MADIDKRRFRRDDLTWGDLANFVRTWPLDDEYFDVPSQWLERKLHDGFRSIEVSYVESHCDGWYVHIRSMSNNDGGSELVAKGKFWSHKQAEIAVIALGRWLSWKACHKEADVLRWCHSQLLAEGVLDVEER